MLKTWPIIAAYVICQSMNALAANDLTKRLNTKEAAASGVSIRYEVETGMRHYQMNFSEFAPCPANQVALQSLNSDAEVQLSAPLEDISGWYEFSLDPKQLRNTRLALRCSKGDRRLYFIHFTSDQSSF